MEASARGLPVIIFRPGTISGHSITGASNRTDSYNRLLETFVQIGCYPENSAVMNLVPVDFVSKFMCHIITHNSPIGSGSIYRIHF
jgi:thioester reductase-like protein